MPVIQTRDSGIQKNIPNFLSAFRILAACAFPFVPPSFRVPLILIAALSEFLDGFLARRWRVVTTLGQLLDPIADKLFILATIGTLIAEGRVTVLQFTLLAARDIVVAIGTMSVLVEARTNAVLQLKPRWSGKVATAFQFALLIVLFTNWSIATPLLYLTIGLSVLSAIDYLYVVLHRRFDPRDT